MIKPGTCALRTVPAGSPFKLTDHGSSTQKGVGVKVGVGGGVGVKVGVDVAVAVAVGDGVGVGVASAQLVEKT
jgi:hypothetical protein